ncbi:MAG: bifunctional molybdenum cofactor biosynthesis protein MoaC/MoaB [Flavobacteriales bacterium]|nr:bifunctional molybdenum cofactor biosynthesis protein MoaC/MoaB [Flavobacteriales bacterium]
MRDISWKVNTLRIATAQSIVKASPETIEMVKNKTIPKGDIFEMAKVTGFLAVKKTSDVIPHCHPLPIEGVKVNYEIEDDKIIIEVEVKTIYKTGCEVEAMYGASVVAITIYDLLKPIDTNIEILSTKLLRKKGGKTDFKDKNLPPLTSAVIVSSDSVSAGKKEDKAGLIIKEKLEGYGVKNAEYTIIPDEPSQLTETINRLAGTVNLIIITGGTGLSPRDKTPETILPLLEREIPGMMEAARTYGQARTPYAMLSRGVAGTIGKTLILTFPGSTGGAKESMDALFPYILHVFHIMNDGKH